MERLFKALGDQTRLALVKALLDKEQTVTSLVQHIKKAQPTVSLQLKLLELNGIVTSRKEGKFVFYKVKHQQIRKLLDLGEHYGR
ncbi:winged helix-turn-helix transcriptional regulator [Candidatus Woesearchaeota archaeon]|nr:winged helix-turn-helix transcriptional regulator [Candidatus Woesearchaeota archaeon]